MEVIDATGVDVRHARVVRRLVEVSEEQGHGIAADLPWDEPDVAVPTTDPRFELPPFDPLARTAWYRSLPSEDRARIGADRACAALRVGWEFENLLQQGLLRQALHADNLDPEFAYLHHEVVEESEHTMMFHRFVAQTSPEARGMDRWRRISGDVIVHLSAHRLRALFYVLVLGGEIPVDTLQRGWLRDGPPPPLLERITSIHVEEEARHVAFANSQLRRIVPRLGRIRRALLSLAIPFVLADMTRMMVMPSPWVLDRWNVPRSVRRAMRRDPETHALLAASAERIRRLCDELGLQGRWVRPLWRLARIA